MFPESRYTGIDSLICVCIGPSYAVCYVQRHRETSIDVKRILYTRQRRCQEMCAYGIGNKCLDVTLYWPTVCHHNETYNVQMIYGLWVSVRCFRYTNSCSIQFCTQLPYRYTHCEKKSTSLWYLPTIYYVHRTNSISFRLQNIEFNIYSPSSSCNNILSIFGMYLRWIQLPQGWRHHMASRIPLSTDNKRYSICSRATNQR